MTAHLMYIALGIWLATLVVSGYATYRLFEYGPFNANLIWGIARMISNKVTCVAFGLAVAMFYIHIAPRAKDYQYLAVIYFLLGIILGGIILYFVLQLIAHPYIKKGREMRQYYDEMREAKDRLTKEGLYPHAPDPFAPKEERDKFHERIEELRRQGKLPTAPKSMQKSS